METGKRIEYIDALRGFARILVLYFHIPSYCLGNAYIAGNDILEWVRMPLFFFISGFLFFKADRIWNSDTIRKVLKNKFRVHIIPMAVFMTLFLILFDYMEPASFGSDKKGYWYTFVLFEYFIFYIGTEALLNRNRTTSGEIRVMITVILISLISFYYAKYYIRYTEELGSWKTILGLLSFVKVRHFFFFWFGTIVRKHFSKFISITNNYSILIILAIIFLSLLFFPPLYHISGIEYIVYIISGIVNIILTFTLFRKLEKVFSHGNWLGKSLQFIGRRTLDIYLIHYFLLPYYLQDFGAWLIQQDIIPLEVIFILFLSLCIICISLITSRIIRISPFLAYHLLGAEAKNYQTKFGLFNNYL